MAEQTIELVHPEDPESKVVQATGEVQVAAFKSVGFVEADALKKAKEDEAQTAKDELSASQELEAVKKELAATKKELADVKKQLKAAKADAPKADQSKQATADGNKENK